MSGLIVHEWLEKFGGAERVVDAMRQAFPDAGLLALWNDAPERYPGARETWLARTPLRQHKAAALPFELGLWPGALRHIPQPDWVLVSSHLFAHQVGRWPHKLSTPKLVYVHTPARYIWEPSVDTRGKAWSVKVAAAMIRPIDKKRASQATELSANSHFVQSRIERVWQRPAKVIYPPVDISAIQSVVDWRVKLRPDQADFVGQLPPDYILGASRMVPYKRLEWVVRASAMLNHPAVIAGSGPEEAYLRSLAEDLRAPVEFIVSPPDELLYALYQRAGVYAFPAVEDFGIMPVEAQALGTPVAVTSIGGSTEPVTNGVTGAIAEADDQENFTQAIAVALDLGRVEATGLAERFSSERFVREIQEWVARWT